MQSDAEAKRFEAGTRTAIIYIYRADAPNSGGVSTLWLDDRLVGQSLPNTFFRVNARPGRNRITASGNDVGRLEIDTREGDVYFVSMSVFGEGEGSSNTIFRSVTPEIGKQEILRCCTMLETWRPGQWRMPW